MFFVILKTSNNLFYFDLVIMKIAVQIIKLPPRIVCDEGTSSSRKKANTIAITGSRPAMRILAI